MQKDRYTLIEKSSNFRITCMQHSQKNFMRIIGNDQKNNGQNFWEILEIIIGKISSIIGTGLINTCPRLHLGCNNNSWWSLTITLCTYIQFHVHHSNIFTLIGTTLVLCH